jgi:hypothetical protein
MGDAESPFVPPYYAAHPALQVAVPARRAAQPGGKARRLRQVRPANPFHMEDRRDPVPGKLHRLRLDLALECRHLVQRERRACLKAGNLADPVPEAFGEVGGLRDVSGEIAGDLSHVLVEAQLPQ